MTTASIIMAACLIALCAVAAFVVIRYARKHTELEKKAVELDEQERGIQVRHNALDRWAADLKDQAKRQAAWDEAHKHIYANVEVLDSAEEKPTAKAIGKSLSSKIGYALRKQFPAIQERRDDKNGGRTVYSVDFYVAPFTDQK